MNTKIILNKHLLLMSKSHHTGSYGDPDRIRQNRTESDKIGQSPTKSDKIRGQANIGFGQILSYPVVGATPYDTIENQRSPFRKQIIWGYKIIPLPKKEIGVKSQERNPQRAQYTHAEHYSCFQLSLARIGRMEFKYYVHNAYRACQ